MFRLMHTIQKGIFWVNRMEQNGTEWNRMEQNGTEWNRIEQELNGTEWNRTERSRTEQNGTERNRMRPWVLLTGATLRLVEICKLFGEKLAAVPEWHK